ncbi:hypothetical protein MANI_020114 [Metarhizium anisopliae]
MFTCDSTDAIITVYASPTPEIPKTPDDTESSTPTGAIVGGFVGGVVGLAVIGVSIFLLLRRRRKKTRGQQPLEGGTASDNRSSTATPAMSVAEATSPTFQNELGVDKNNKEGRQNSSVAEAQELPGRP